MTEQQTAVLELEDIQAPVLRLRPFPYRGAYFVVRIDDPAHGREMLGRLAPKIASAAERHGSADTAWVNVALTFQGLKALGVPQDSLDSFSPEFQQGMAARAALLGDVGESAPANWEKPFGTHEVHVVVAVVCGEEVALEPRIDFIRTSQDDLPGVSIIWQLKVSMLPTVRTHLGYRDGISSPLIEGSGSPGQGPAIKAGEFILGYPDETGNLPPMPQPEVLGRNGTYLAVRKLYSDVAKFRRYLRANAESPEEEGLLQAKMWGAGRAALRWCSPPSATIPSLRPIRNETTTSATTRRTPRASSAQPALTSGAITRGMLSKTPSRLVNIHRVVRRGFVYGPMLPEGAMEDDGAERGSVFAFLNANLARQYEFIKSAWQNEGNFVSLDEEKDPIAGPNDGTGTFTIPRRPVRKRLQGIPRFVTTKGGEYCFLPSIRALHWLANLDT